MDLAYLVGKYVGRYVVETFGAVEFKQKPDEKFNPKIYSLTRWINNNCTVIKVAYVENRNVSASQLKIVFFFATARHDQTILTCFVGL